jgi:hypothetical protein
MTPSAEQIRQASLNHRQPARTQAAKIREALQHVKVSQQRKTAIERR